MKKLISSPYQVTYLSNKIENPKRVVVLLHGYLQTGQYIYKKLIDLFDGLENTLVLAPDGIFPVPYPDPMNAKMMAYSWYFYSPKEEKFYVPYEIPAELLSNFINELGLKDLPKTIIGFSQGGYLSSQLALQLTNVEKIIGVGCAFRDVKNLKGKSFKVILIHGDQDDHVKLDEAKRTEKELKEINIDAHLDIQEGLGHFILDDVKNVVAQYI